MQINYNKQGSLHQTTLFEFILVPNFYVARKSLLGGAAGLGHQVGRLLDVVRRVVEHLELHAGAPVLPVRCIHQFATASVNLRLRVCDSVPEASWHILAVYFEKAMIRNSKVVTLCVLGEEAPVLVELVGNAGLHVDVCAPVSVLSDHSECVRLNLDFSLSFFLTHF